MSKYTIQFNFPEPRPSGTEFFAGQHKGAAGYAATLDTAWFWEDRESATRWLENGYGSMRTFGRVIEVDS